jgi:uncharacterized membrane-anchored protein
MNPLLRKGIWVAVVQVAILGSLGGKLMVDRATRPRVWVRTTPVDPDLPIRGRYVRLRVEAAVGPGLALAPPPRAVNPGSVGQTTLVQALPVSLSIQNERLVALPSPDARGLYAWGAERDGRTVAILNEPLAYFIPEHVTDPSRRAAGEELWAEVTIPRAGAPRPIRLGVKKDGVLTPLELK